MLRPVFESRRLDRSGGTIQVDLCRHRDEVKEVFVRAPRLGKPVLIWDTGGDPSVNVKLASELKVLERAW